MAQPMDAQVGISSRRREQLSAALPDARSSNAFELPCDELEASAPARGIDVFRLVVALTGIAAFLARPAALIAGVAFLLR